MRSIAYTREDLETCYRNLGVVAGDCVYVTGNLGRLGPLKLSKEAIITMHAQALLNIVGASGTIVVPTHSFSLCNTDTVFDCAKTPSETGALTQFFLDLPESIRQFHPFSSRVAIGRYAKDICLDCSRASYGYHTPFQRMLSLNAKFISIGMHPRFSVSLVHQCEQDMGVPYRYNKEFIHPVLRQGKVLLEPFYHLVTYLESDISRNQNQLFFDEFEQSFTLQSASIGLGNIYIFNMQEFYKSTTNIMKNNIYSWLNHAPKNRPYQK